MTDTESTEIENPNRAYRRRLMHWQKHFVRDSQRTEPLKELRDRLKEERYAKRRVKAKAARKARRANR